jgi:hypothetical protein
MGLRIEYRDNKGRKHNSLDSMVKAEMDKLVNEAARNVERVVGAQRCPIHGKTPSISITKHREGFSYTIDGCCDELVRRAEAAIQPYLD